MPELPEVETVRRGLQQRLLGKRIVDVVIHYAKIAHGDSPDLWRQLLKDYTIDAIDRVGKYLIIRIGPHRLVIHLRMEGKFFVGAYGESNSSVHFDWLVFYSRHAHLGLRCSDDTIVIYHDTRKFGRLHLYPHWGDQPIPELAALGKEPLVDLPEDYFYHHVHHSHRTLKQLLLDQQILLGLGNIYADETCFRAGIYPYVKGSQLSRLKCKKVEIAAKTILTAAIEVGGTTIRTFEPSHYVDGLFSNQTEVYGREGEPCRVCGTPIRRDMRIGRSTHWCPSCQKR